MYDYCFDFTLKFYFTVLLLLFWTLSIRIDKTRLQGSEFVDHDVINEEEFLGFEEVDQSLEVYT